MKNKHLLAEFNPINKKEWIAAIEKHLKGQPAHSLDWQLEEGVTISPLVRQKDIQTHLLGTIDTSTANEWYITEKIHVGDDYELANKQALEALQKGVQALYFELEVLPTTADFTLLWKDILLELVPIHLEGKGIALQPNQVLEALLQVPNIDKWRGSWNINSSAHNILHNQLLHYIEKGKQFASFQPITITIEENTTDSLAEALYKTSIWIDFLRQNNVPMVQIIDLFRFEFYTSELYFVEIAKFRAFKRLWLAMLEAYGVKKADYPYIHANTTLSMQQQSPYWNMITATTQAMSAVMGGVHSLMVCPSNGWEETDDFSRRIGRNLQHLLATESYLGRVIDPASGSYYIENLTEQLTVQSWQKFCDL